MMRQVVDKLREQEYVSTANVEAIRRYIRVRYPNSSKEELSVVFADALHKVIDKRIYQFEEDQRKRIKEKVLRKAVAKEKFSIDAAEVFNACLEIKVYDNSYIDSFTSWINTNQDIHVSGEKVTKLLDIAKQYDEGQIDGNVDDLLDQFSESWAEDMSMAGMGIEMKPEEQPDIIDTPSEVVEESVPEVVAEEAVGAVQEEAAVSIAPEVECVGKSTAAEVLERVIALFVALTGLISENLPHVRPSLRIAAPLAVPIVLAASLLFLDLLEDNSIDALRHREQGQYIDIRESYIDRYFSLESRILEKAGGVNGSGKITLIDVLHEDLKYTEVNKERLKGWLDKKKSLLSDEPYFSGILGTAREYDIHPLLMFAIAGQEQAFVPRSGNFSGRIANNPFNVYGSWEKYNTNIYDSSRLAAGVIISSSRGRPAYMNPIRWMNKKYAEDQNWWKNVSKLFEQMKKDIME